MAKARSKQHVKKEFALPIDPVEDDVFVQQEVTSAEVTDIPQPTAKKPPKYFFNWLRASNKRLIPALLLFALIIITAVPPTRYILPGIFIKKKLSFIIQDATSHARISDANIELDDKLFTSDQNGVVSVDGIVPGQTSVKIDKLFYKPFEQKISVSIFNNKQFTFNITSTGRPAKVTVKNRFSGRLLAGVTVKTEQGSQAKTGSDGTAQLVLPSDKSEVMGTLSGDGIVTADVSVRAVQDDSTNVFKATPVGRIYFLSKASGAIDVVKTNLDGTDRQVTLAGTGKEIDTDTILLASQDWKYLALKSRRDSVLPKIYLIETATDKVTTIDEGDANFSMIGWSGSNFVYSVTRNGAEQWQNNRQALKSYNAVTKQLVVLDQTRGEGTSYNDYGGETIAATYVLKDTILYTKTWYASYYYGTHLANKSMVVNSIKADGSGKATLRSWPAGYNASINATYKGPDDLYFYIILDGVQTSYWEYKDGAIKQVMDVSAEDFQKAYPTYLESPNGLSTFWSESRDGKNVLFIGDSEGKNSKQIADLSEYNPYGWFTNDYILVSKNGSELYIMGRDGIKPGDVPTKIADYHKPDYNFTGYGKGYGGL